MCSDDFSQASTQAGQFVQLSAGYRHTCGITAVDHQVVCWGNCEKGECTPTVAGPFEHVSCGNKYTCAITTAGQTVCWGEETEGRTIVPEGFEFSVVEASKGGYHTCGIKTDGSLSCWGRSSSFSGLPSGNHFTTLSVGARQTCAGTVAGDLTCFGPSNAVPTPYVCKTNGYCYDGDPTTSAKREGT